MNILLIEPDVVLARLYTQALNQAGHSSTWVSSAQQAIDAAGETQPDVVLLELSLPHHNGVEFLHEFRSYSDWVEIPVIIISHLPRSHFLDHSEALELLGISEYLYKPLTSLSLLTTKVTSAVPAAS